jgi:RHS repeat-associated protein
MPPRRPFERRPRALLFLIVLLACVLGGKAPPSVPGTSPGLGTPVDPAALAVTCPSPDSGASPFPAELPAADTAPAGSLPGTFAVSRSGEATYSIPLAVLPGRAGMEPALSISYNSGAGEGFLGVGFGLAGLSVITRCPQNLAQDHHIRAVRYDELDPYCLDGARLVQVGEESAPDGSRTREFRTFPDSFSKVVAHYGPSQTLARGPDRFEVFARSGHILAYGATQSSRAMAMNQVVAAWWMSEERDRYDNAVSYSYYNAKDPGDGHTIEIFPYRIGYAHRADHTPGRVVELIAGDAPSPNTYYSGGMRLRRSKVLARIDMKVEPGGTVVRSHHLDYTPGEGTGRALLRSIEECAGATGPCLPATRFTWNDHPSTGLALSGTVGGGPWKLGAGSPWMLADVNGDGLMDLVMPWAGNTVSADGKETFPHGVSVALNRGTSFAPWADWFQYVSANEQPKPGISIDYDQDGRTDILFQDDYYDLGHHAGQLDKHLRVLRARPGGGFEMIDTGIAAASKFRLGDLDGDGVADLLICDSSSPEGNAWSVHFWSPATPAGPGFDPSPVTIPPLSAVPCTAIDDKELRIVDLDGDGKGEIVMPPSAYFGDGLGGGNATWSPDGTVTCGGSPCRYATVSFDGAAWTMGETNLVVHTLSSRDSTTTSTAAISGSPDMVVYNHQDGFVTGETIFADVNGDGLPDAVKTGYGDGRPRTFLNTGAGFGTSGVPSLSGPSLPDEQREDRFAHDATVIDADGDGLTDLLVPMPFHCADPSDEKACWVVWRSRGDGTFTVWNTGIYFPEDQDDHASSAAQNVQVLDIGGDGRHDVAALVSGAGDKYVFALYEADGPQDLLASITDGRSPLDPGDPGFVPTVAIHYGNLVDRTITDGISPDALAYDDQTYIARADPNNGCTYPRACVTGPMRVVRSYRVANGRNEQRTFYVKYRDGRYHRTGRGFLGFGERIVIDGDTAAGASEQYDNVTHDEDLDVFPFAGQVVRSATWTASKPHWLDPGQVDVTFAEAALSQRTSSQGATFYVTQDHAHTIREEGVMQPAGGTSVLRYVKAAADAPLDVLGEAWDTIVLRDDFGNALIETHQVDGADLQTTVSRTVDNDAADWLLGLVRYERVCSTALGKTHCRTTTRDYDDQGAVKSATVGDPNDPGTQLSLAFAYDGSGHLTWTKAADAFGHHRASCTSYDAEGIFPYATANALGHVSFARFDPGLGVMTAAVDPNGLATRWRHDGLGRVTEELRPDGTSTTLSLARTKDGGPLHMWWSVKATTSETGGAASTTEIDSLGRPVHTITVAANVETCGASVCKPVLQLEDETHYDFLGNVERVVLPWMSGDALSGKLHHTFFHDAAGRVTKHVEPSGRTTTFAYHGNTASATDWLGTVTTHRDALGRVVEVVDKKGYSTQTQYGPFGAPEVVTRTGGDVTVVNHDAYGRVIHEQDPDRGHTDIAYDGFGEALTVDDDAGRHDAFTYDALGRLVQRDDADGQTRWEYDTAPHGIGKLATVTNPVSVKRYTYDPLSRPASVALALGSEILQATFGYDAQSRLHVIAYPQAPGVAPLVLLRDYDARGDLISVRDNAGGKPFWQLTKLDGAGRATGETFGNDVKAVHEFDPHTGLVQHIQAVHGHTRIQDLLYTYDPGHRMQTRRDRLQVGPKGERTELFMHDALDRLTCARFTDVPSGQQPPAKLHGPCAVSVKYDATGNITHKSDVGDYTYDPAQPHAVRQAGTLAFDYDAVGNQKERPGASLTHTAFDLPKAVTLDGESVVRFFYDGDQQRILKQAPEAETISFEGLYERVTPSGGAPVHKYYVAAGSATLVLSRQAGKKDDIAYLHTEALGSTDVVSNEHGAAVERRSYDAFGARRNPKWGQPLPASGYASKASPMGFTGHESDDDLGLVNMRGRIYDPKVGRFLQVDPIVSAPHFGQSWNPYSYVGNRPLDFVDPSGFQAEIWMPTTVIHGTPPTMDERLKAVVNSLVRGPGPSPTPAAPWEPYAKLGNEHDDRPASAPQAQRERSPFGPGSMGGMGSAETAGAEAAPVDWAKVVKEGTLNGLYQAANMMTLGNLGVAATLWNASKPTNSPAVVVVSGMKIAPVLGTAISLGEKLGKLYDGGVRMSTGEKVVAGAEIAVDAANLVLGARGLVENPRAMPEADGLADLARFRAELGQRAGEGTIARLDAGGRSFYGINAHGRPITLRVNAISRTHAETDAFQQAVDAGVKGGRGRLFVDRALCPACGKNGGVAGLARQLGLEELEVVTPQGTEHIEP